MTKQEKLKRFDILESVNKMSTGSILRELEGGMKPGICDSWGERVAFTDRNKVIDLLINKRLEETV
jgi:hypothetical protein